MDFSLALFIYEYAKQQSAFFSQVVCLAKVYNFCHQVALLGAIHKLHNPISEESGSPPSQCGFCVLNWRVGFT